MKNFGVILEGENLEKMGVIWGENGDIFRIFLCNFYENLLYIFEMYNGLRLE